MRYSSEVVRFGYPVLRDIARPVVDFNKSLTKLLEVMKKTLMERDDGAALAAPQIAVLQRVIVMDYEGEFLEVINPKYLFKSAELVNGTEGCLSLPEYFGNVMRHKTIKIEFYDRDGRKQIIERSDEVARCLQHEIDHLDGILFVDRMTDHFVTNGKDQIERTKYAKDIVT